MVTAKFGFVLGSLVLLASTSCSSTDGPGFETLGSSAEALTPVQPGIRPSIHDLSPAERAELVGAILDFITQPVLDEHVNGHDWHHPLVGELFFIRHHDYLNQLEVYLSNNGYQHLLPLAEWDPATPIPDEFLVTDPLVSQAPLRANPNLPLPPQFDDLCSFRTASDLAVQIEDWHGTVHGTVGGAMGSIAQAPGAPIFWLWHGFLDDIYHEYHWRCSTLPALLALF